MKILPKKAYVRSGFTLVELLVVIAIIGVLLSLVVSAVYVAMSGSQEANTKLTCQKVHKMVEKQWRAVVDNATDDIKNNNSNYQSMVTAFGLQNNPDQAAVIWVKMNLKRQFPVSFAEINDTSLSAYGLPPVEAYTYARSHLSWTAPAGLETQAESAACLLLALQNGRRGVSTDIDVLNKMEKGNTTGLPYLTDNWGKPIMFFRWPQGSGLSITALPKDPDDPLGVAGASAVPASIPPLVGPNAFMPNPLNGNLMGYRFAVVSMGKDNISGLDINMNKLPSSANAFDDIFSIPPQ